MGFSSIKSLIPTIPILSFWSVISTAGILLVLIVDCKHAWQSPNFYYYYYYYYYYIYSSMAEGCKLFVYGVDQNLANADIKVGRAGEMIIHRKGIQGSKLETLHIFVRNCSEKLLLNLVGIKDITKLNDFVKNVFE